MRISPKQFMIKPLALISTGCLLFFSASCSNQVKPETARLEHKFVYGKTAYIDPSGKAYAPPKAPKRVKRMIDAANRIRHAPYKYGGGHRSFYDSGYDCSGATSYVLHAGDVLDKTMVSQQFLDYGKKGYGDWVNIYVRKGHVFLEIAGLRFDTGGTWNSTGPRWKPQSRGLKNYYVRHPRGL